MMMPDIVEIKRLCSSGQWTTRIENGKILLHDTVAGEMVCIGQTDAEPARHGEWRHIGGDEWCCTICGEVIFTEGSWKKPTKKYCNECGAKMDGGKQDG